MRVIIDRLEENFAVVETETGVMVDLPRILVPEAKEMPYCLRKWQRIAAAIICIST